MRPFFSYFGSKYRLAKEYCPSPAYDTIVEPFAGSACFSIRHADRNVILYDKDPVVAGVWDYLIRVTPQEILSIPDIPPGGSTDDLHICQEAKWLVGFRLCASDSSPKKKPGKRMRIGARPKNYWGAAIRELIASQVGAIRHWKIYNRSYVDCDVTQPATWFVDPPYQEMGKHYRCGSKDIDYAELGSWCQTLQGEVIVCENTGATWLPFRHFASTRTTRGGRMSNEAFWSNSFGEHHPMR